MNPAEVVVHEVQRDSRYVVLHLLGEGVGQPGEPTHGHPHSEVLALHVGRRDVLRVRVTLYNVSPCTRVLGGAVTLLVRVVFAVQLYKHRIVNLATEGILYRSKVRLVTVARELNTRGQPVGQVRDKLCGVFCVSPSDVPAGN